MQNHRLFSSNKIYFFKCQKADEKKKSIEDEQTLEELNSAHRCSQEKCQLIQTSYINEINFLGLSGRTLTYDLSQAGFSHTDLLLR